MTRFVFALCLCLWSTSCSTLELYAQQRAQDFADCFALEVAVGTAEPVSFVAGIELPGPLPLGFGYSAGKTYGMWGRTFGVNKYSVSNASIFTLPAQIAIAGILFCLIAPFVYVMPDDPPEVFDAFPPIDVEGFFVDRNQEVQFEKTNRRSENPDRRFRVSANFGVSVFYIYADVELAEIGDFVLGIFCIDLMSDDVGSLVPPIDPTKTREFKPWEAEWVPVGEVSTGR